MINVYKQPKSANTYANLFIQEISDNVENVCLLFIGHLETIYNILVAKPGVNFTVIDGGDTTEALPYIYNGANLKESITFKDSWCKDNDTFVEGLHSIFNNMPFDLIIANPPFDGNLFLKIIQKTLPVADKTVVLAPTRWLQDPTAKYSTKTDYSKFADIRESLQDVKVINKREASKLFDTCFETDIGVYKLGKQKLYDETKLSYNSVVEKVIQKIISKDIQSLKDRIENFKLDGCRVRVPTLRGDTGIQSVIQTIGFNFYYLHFSLSMVYVDGYTKDGIKWSENRVKQTGPANDFAKGLPTSIGFPSFEEGVNFEKSTQTNFFRYVFNKMKTGKGIPNAYLPFMGDYKSPWTDERFYKFFNISKDEQQQIIDYLKSNNVPNVCENIFTEEENAQ